MCVEKENLCTSIPIHSVKPSRVCYRVAELKAVATEPFLSVKKLFSSMTWPMPMVNNRAVSPMDQYVTLWRRCSALVRSCASLSLYHVCDSATTFRISWMATQDDSSWSQRDKRTRHKNILFCKTPIILLWCKVLRGNRIWVLLHRGHPKKEFGLHWRLQFQLYLQNHLLQS